MTSLTKTLTKSTGNLRTDATLGMGCFNMAEAVRFNGTRVDYYEHTVGNKREGVVTSVTSSGYYIKDTKTKTPHFFSFRA